MKAETEQLSKHDQLVIWSVLIACALITLSLSVSNKDLNEIEQINTQSSSTEIVDIQADITATKLPDFTDELAELEKKIPN